MLRKPKDKQRAIDLRKEGKTYGEILKEIPVAKSTLSLWLREVGLAKKQLQRITLKRVEAQQRGARRRRQQRIETSDQITRLAVRDIYKISRRELWLIGIALYWAEGFKQKEWNVTQGLKFANSDPLMMRIYVIWLKNILSINEQDIEVSLAIHENHITRIPQVIQHLKTVTGLTQDFSDKVYLKRNRPSGNRHNLGERYYGTLRIAVRKSTNLNRKVTGWIRGICNQCGVV